MKKTNSPDSSVSAGKQTAKNTELTRRGLIQAGSLGLAATVAQGALGASQTASRQAATGIDWNLSADVVVCGSGAAGCMAALSASKAGASVLLIEKSAVWGGTSSKSGFHIWIPNNAEMKKLDIEDDREACLQYMAQHSYPHLFDINSKTLGLPEHLYTLLETYYDNGPATVKKIADWDVVEFRVARLGREQIAAVDYNDTSPYNKATVGRSIGPIDRQGHWTMGRYVTAEFRKRLLDDGVAIHMQHRATALHKNLHGQVIGVSASNADGQTVNIRAKRGVIFGSGCYSANKQYMNQFQMLPVMGGCGAPSNEGDFIAIGGSVGAQLGNMSGAWRAQVVLEDSIDFVSAPSSVFWPIGDSMFIVNKYGKRCLNEKRNYNDRTKGLYAYDANKCEFPNMVNFMIYDQRCADLFGGSYPIPEKQHGVDYVAKGVTLEELAEDIEARLAQHAAHTGNLTLDTRFTKNLKRAFHRFNDMAREGVDKDFQRGDFEYDKAWHDMRKPKPDPRWPDPINPDNTTMHPLQEKGPYYAIILLPGCIGTNGGPVINERGQVQDYNNQPIEGLFGAGNCIASPAANAYWGGGTTIGSALIFGRLAGETAARESIKEDIS